MSARGLFLPAERMPAAPGYIPSLDGIRAISIMIVLLAHIVSTRIFPGGLGVSIFFTISGFLICRLLFGEIKANGSVDLPRFYLRRALRLYPVVLLFTALVLGVYVVKRLPIDWPQPLSALFYFSNYLYDAKLLRHDPQPFMPFMIFWSLSIEEHFYLVFPGLFLLSRGRPKVLLAAMAAACVACLALRVGTAHAHPALIQTRTFYYGTQYRFDAIAYGVALAALCEFPGGRELLRRVARPAWFFAWIAAILACLVYREPVFRETWRYSVIGIAIAGAIAGALFEPRLGWVQRLLNTRALVFVGRLSYSLYVWHFVSPEIVRTIIGGQPHIVNIVPQLAVSFALAIASYHLVERPVLALRHRIGSKARGREPRLTLRGAKIASR